MLWEKMDPALVCWIVDAQGSAFFDFDGEFGMLGNSRTRKGLQRLSKKVGSKALMHRPSSHGGRQGVRKSSIYSPREGSKWRDAGHGCGGAICSERKMDYLHYFWLDQSAGLNPSGFLGDAECRAMELELGLGRGPNPEAVIEFRRANIGPGNSFTECRSQPPQPQLASSGGYWMNFTFPLPGD